MVPVFEARLSPDGRHKCACVSIRWGESAIALAIGLIFKMVLAGSNRCEPGKDKLPELYFRNKINALRDTALDQRPSGACPHKLSNCGRDLAGMLEFAGKLLIAHLGGVF